MDLVLYEILALLLISVLMVSLFKRINLPPIIGYIVVGIIMGPYALSLVQDEENIHFLADFGIVFMLFSIGLQFSIAQFLSMKRTILQLGGLQVILSMLVFGLLAYFVGVSWEVALIAGGALAMSSTAVALKQLTEQAEMQSRHGRNTFGILLFQDFAAIPLLIIIPVLGAYLSVSNELEQSIGEQLLWALLKGIFAIIVLLALGRTLLRWVFKEVAKNKSNELFTLTVLMVAIGAATLTSSLGLSMALGAFIAGMMLAETEYRHQVASDIRPFQDVLLGLFFITIGMLINLATVWQNLSSVLLLVLGLVTLKALIISLLSRAYGDNAGVALRTALSLAHVGEFGFALLSLMFSQQLFPVLEGQVLLAAAIFSMMLSPIMIKYNGLIAQKLVKNTYAQNLKQQEEPITQESQTLKEHVIICGFGRVGQTLARFLRKANKAYLALDMDIIRTQEAHEAGEPVFYGDAARDSILRAAGLENASLVVISMTNFPTTIKILHKIRKIRPNIRILVRTRNEEHFDEIMAAGATEVIPDAFEASITLASQVLLLLDCPGKQVFKEMKQARQSRYRLLQGYYPSVETEPNQALDQQALPILHTIQLAEQNKLIGSSIYELLAEHPHIEVLTLKRDEDRIEQPAGSTQLYGLDRLVIRGVPEHIERFKKSIV